MKKMSKKKVKNPNKGILLQWGVPIAILVAVVIILVSKFSSVSNSTAQESINRRLTTETGVYANTLSDALNSIGSVSIGAASIVEQESVTDKDVWANCAATLKKNVDNVYLVAIVDSVGIGVTNTGEEISLERAEYYNNNFDTGFVYVDDDAITGEAAIISYTPLMVEGRIRGHIYMYVRPTDLEKLLPTKEYGGSVGFAIMSSDGTMMKTVGTTGYFNSGANLFDNLSDKDVTLTQLTVPQIKVRAEKMTKMTFGAKKDAEDKTITIAPLGINDWQLVIIINQKYVETVKSSELSNARGLIIGLAITIISFLVLVIVIEIISRLKYGEENKDLADKADTDLLTELNNKMATERKIQEYMDENPDSQCLMFLFDVDNFKKINDTMGHAFGDEVLRTLGHQLRNEFRVSDIIGRLGGDEFVLFLKNIRSDEQLEREGVRITNFFHQFRAGDYVKYSATASIGGAVFPRDAKDFQSLYKAADVALYEAKRRGKNQLVVYSNDIANVESVRVSDDIDPIE